MQAKYIIKFEKSEAVKYVSHLDLVRVFGRTFRRAGLPISHSQGFNPHPILTFAHPLSVGISSLCELAEFSLDEALPENEVMEKMNAALPPGFKVTEVKQLEGKNNFARLALADYKINIYIDKTPTMEQLDAYINQPQIMCIRKTKSKTENTDIKPFIDAFKVEGMENGSVQITARLKTGAENLKPLLLASSVVEFLGYELIGTEICRVSLLDGEGKGL